MKIGPFCKDIEDIHPLCRLQFDARTGDYGCSYHSLLSCDECRYGAGRKDPEAKSNRPKATVKGAKNGKA